MRTYRIQEEVPWSDITDILYWYLKLRVRGIWNHQERGDQRAVEMELPYLRTTLESVRRLRRFLGRGGETKWEREARRLLESENTP